MKKIKRAISLLIFIAIGTYSYLAFDLYSYAKRVNNAPDTDKTFIISPGQSLKTISLRLAQENIITHPFKFKLLAKLKGKDTSIKAGEYTLNTRKTPTSILTTLTSGKVKLYKITIPEGYNMDQIGTLVEEKELTSKEAFLACAKDKELLKKMEINADSFEGYLYPDTYQFSKGISEKTIIQTMVKRFKEIMTPELERRAKSLNFTVHQVVTLASIIEKETGVADERPIISSVFHNRLKKNMRLESDPTVIYGIKDFNGNITRKDLRTRTPYNTYKIKGLPPGPIANPGKEAIEAALYPDTTKYLYFVAKRDSTHQFSTNIRDHNRAVRKYQLRRK